MPSVTSTVSVSEVLEVRDGPLTDIEIWALLKQATEALQEGFLAGGTHSDYGPVFVINPDTVNLTAGGTVEFRHAHNVQQYANYMAPEAEEPEFESSASSTELLYVFALGKSLVYSSEYGLKMDEPVRISENLESLLRSMTNRNPSQRATLRRVAEACHAQNEREQRGLRRSLSKTVTNLYQSILGPDTQEEDMRMDESFSSNVGDSHTASHQKVSPRELTLDRSRRKQKSHDSSRKSHDPSRKSHDSSRKSLDSRRRSQDSGSRRMRRTSPEQYRSRSRSWSRSRSRSPSKHKGHGRESDSPDSGFHRITPLPSGAYARSGDENGGRRSRPDLNVPGHHHDQPYHLSDITFSASQNGHHSHRQTPSSSHHSRPSSRNHQPSQRSFESAAFKKYLKLKERHKKLRVLRNDAMSDDASDELSDFVVDHISETRSVRSVGSNVGVYHPDLHMRYGSNSALRLGRDSDKDSVVSSDASVYGPETQAFRATADISDPYIQQLQQLTSSQPPIMSSQTTPTPQAPPRKHGKQKKKPPSPKQQKKAASPKPQKPRDFYGPEFVHKSSKPLQRIPLPLIGESRKNPGHVCRVVVVLLNGQKLEAMVDPSTTGQQLFEAVVTEIELPEFYFFGLTYVNDNEHFFMSAETKLHKVAPDGWKESWKREVAPITFTVYLRVKYYVDALPALKHETSRHQLYLQLRRDILEERCLCDEDKVMTLAGLALQAEYGDYTRETMGRNYFIPEHYFPERTVKRLGTSYVRDHAPDEHRLLAGMTEMEAQMEFIKYVQEQVPEYGIHFHKLLKKKGETHNVIWVGVNMNHLVLAENSNNSRIIVHQHPWSSLQKISFNRRRFSVQPRPDLGQIKPFKLNFYTTSYKKGQYLLKFCTSQHSFQLKIRTRLAAHDGITDLSQSEHMSIGDAEDINSEHSDDNHTITEENGSRGSRGSRHSQELEMVSGGFTATDHVPQKHPAAYRHPPPYKPDASASMIDIPINMRDNSHPRLIAARSATADNVNQGLPPHHLMAGAGDSETESGNSAEGSVVTNTDLVQPSNAYVIDASIRSTDQTLYPASGNETISQTLHQRFHEELLSPENFPCEREVFEVTLQKQPQYGIGITIVGGDSAKKHSYGIFVKSISVDGPAHKDGRIKPGDQLIAINDKSLEGLQHHEAVNMIKDSGESVKLLISQVKPPGSLRRPDFDYNAEEVFQWKLQNSLAIKPYHVKQRDGSSSEDSDESVSNVVTTVHNNTDVNSADKMNKNDNKNIENEKNAQKDGVDVEARHLSIPEGLSEAADHESGISATVDIHSTLSQVDSLHSEVEASEILTDHKQEPMSDVDESETDSEFEEVCTAVIENTYNTAPHADDDDGRQNGANQAEVFEVFLEKQLGSFGLNVTGGVNTSVRHGGIYVKSLIEGSVAENDGTIRKGDRILEVDNIDLTGFTHKQAVETLCNAPPFCKLLIERSPLSHKLSQRSSRSRQSDTASPSSPNNGHGDMNGMTQEDIYSTFVTEDNSYTVDLAKGTYGLGFSTIGGHNGDDAEPYERVVRIKRVFPIGPASGSGLIRSGDVILAVNGQSVEGKTHNETMSMLRCAGKQVQLLMCHPDPDQLPPLVQLDSEESLQITPSGSTSNVSDTDSDTDSEIDVTPRREALITPPTGFALSPIPVDEDGNLMPKIASPPPPLPVSPPPTMLSTVGDSGDSDTPRDGDTEIQVGVAELMDSCRSELNFLHTAKHVLPQGQLNTSLIVREDSALTVNSGIDTPVLKDYSRDATPVMSEDYSREATPVDIAGEVTPVYDQISQDQSDLNVTGETQPESVIDPLTSHDGTMEGFASGAESRESDSDSESEASETLSRTNESTSFVTENRLVSNSPQIDDTKEILGTSQVGTYKVDNSDDSIVDSPDGVRLNSNNDGAHITDSNCTRHDSVNNVSDDSGDQNSDNSDDESDDDDDIKRLEKKYLDIEKEDEVIDDSENDDDPHDEHVSLEKYIDDEDIDAHYHDEENQSDRSDVEVEHEEDERFNSNESGNQLNEEEITKNRTTSKSSSDNESYKNDDNVDSHNEDDDEVEQNENGLINEAIGRLTEGGTMEPEESDSDQASERESPSPILEQLALKPGEFEVTLTRPEGRGLGFTVAGGANTTGGCYVKAVLQNPALSDGHLKSGDKLILVAGVDMRPLNHFEAVSVLREAGETVTIKAYRPSLVGGDVGQADVNKPSLHLKNTNKHEHEINSANQQEGESSESDTDGDNLSKQLDDMVEQFTQNLEETQRENDEKEREAENQSHHEAGDESPVESDSDSQPEGDGPLQDLIQSLEASKTQLTPRGERTSLKAENFWQDKSEKETVQSPDNKSPTPVEPSVYQIDLEKPVHGGLGISLVTAESRNQTGVFIRTITPDGVADMDGRLEVGDKILQINGESLIGMNHTKAAMILRNSQGKLSLTVSRKKGKKPSWLDIDSASNQLRPEDVKEVRTNSGGHESSSDEDYSDLNDTSLSITKHVPSDIVDDGVDELVAQAERILAKEHKPARGHTDSDESDAPPLPEKLSTRNAHEYLSAKEVIDYHPDEIRLESDESEDDNGETNDRNNFYADIDLEKCWCDGLRTLDISVPEEVTADWLFGLSLVTIPEEMKTSIPNLISDLQEKIEIDDPQGEFKQLRNVPITDECETACLSHNRGKNRFRNVLPYDVNRVKISDDDETDYINASHIRIDVAGGVCDYIVSQGPLPDTTSHFWEMVWQQGVTVIVMLTLDMEAMKVKCHRYWPDTADTPIDVCDGRYRLTLLYLNSLDDFDIRSILIEDMESGDTRQVFHLNYTTWPDHGTPKSAVPLLQCMRLSHMLRTHGPLVIHCSAGIGRSGTFITVDVALAHIERGLEFNIMEIVKNLRRQRQGMIQTRDQYLFCYTACVEALLETPT